MSMSSVSGEKYNGSIDVLMQNVDIHGNVN